MSTQIIEHRFPPDDPYFSGHFPENPVVPGVVILDTVFSYLNDEGIDIQIEAIPKAKFTEPVLPGQLLHIEITRLLPRVLFKVYRDKSLVAEGEFKFKQGSPHE